MCESTEYLWILDKTTFEDITFSFNFFHFHTFYRPFDSLCDDYDSVLAGGKTEETWRQTRVTIGYITFLKCYLAVLHSARIEGLMALT